MTATGSTLDPSVERQALDLAPAMIRDLNGTIWLWTLGMERIYGYSRSEAVGRISHRLLQTEFPRPLAVIEAELADQGQWSGELLHRARDSAIVICSTQWVLMKDDAGNSFAV